MPKETNFTPLIWVGAFILLKDSLFGEGKESKDAGKETENVEESKLKDNPFEYATYKLKKREGYSRLVTPAIEIKKAAEQVYDSIGYITDDFSQLLDGIKKTKTKFEIALLSKFYSDNYKHNLYSDMKRNLSKKELEQVNAYVNKLPEYLKGKTN
jgi:hypothetical protein